MSSQSTNVESPRSLESFKFESKISSSKYPVYKAIDPKTENEVAIKLFPFNGFTTLNFRRETSVFSVLDHQNIIKMNECHDCTPSHAIDQ